MSLIKRIISFGSAFVFVLGLGLAVPATSNAAGINDKVCSGINTVLDGTGTVGSSSDCTTAANSNDNKIAKTVSTLINLFSLAVGAVSVVMIIFGGFKYMTSGGSDDKTKDAKNTILYALVGLVIVLLAQTIVKFVFSRALDTVK